MNFNDHIEQERRRVERYSDLSRSAFLAGVIAIIVVAVFAGYVILTR